MKTKIYFTIVFFAILASGFAQNQSWSKFQWIIGEWKGEGGGQPGNGGGTFSFKPDLNDKVLVRKSHSEYSTKDNFPVVVHDDLMIMYLDPAGNPLKAIYFDSEGHTINYAITCTDKTIVLQSEKMPNVPVFRLTYTLLDDGRVNTKFEMSQDGEKFTTYIEGKSFKIK